MHADERRCVEKAILRKFKDKLVEVFGRHAKRVHQGRLDSAGHFSDPGLVVTAFENVDFGERHGMISFPVRRQMVSAALGWPVRYLSKAQIISGARRRGG